MELTKKYGICPECGNDKFGGNPSQGALIIEDEIFTRSCKCGWKVVIDKRIKVVAYTTRKRKGKTSGVYEVRIHGYGHKYLPLNELKELSGAIRVNQVKKIESWLNTDKGRKWAMEVKEASIFG